MKVLILTNPLYKDFIGDIIFPFNADHDVHGYSDARSYPFETWKKRDYDIGISFMYQHKVPAAEVNNHTWFNFHPAPLPQYKGRNLCYHAIMNGETEFGATLHYMDENFDTGDIIEVFKFDIPDWYNAGDLSDNAIDVAKDLFKDYFPHIIAGEEFPRLPNVGGTYYKKEAIVDTVKLVDSEPFGQFVRAVTYGDFYPKVEIGGVTYKIVRDE